MAGVTAKAATYALQHCPPLPLPEQTGDGAVPCCSAEFCTGGRDFCLYPVYCQALPGSYMRAQPQPKALCFGAGAAFQL